MLCTQGAQIAKISCGELHSIALTTDGEVWIWGNGEYGRMGNGVNTSAKLPEPVETLGDFNCTEVCQVLFPICSVPGNLMLLHIGTCRTQLLSCFNR